MRFAAVAFAIALLLSACGGNNLSENAVVSDSGECPADHQIKGNQNSKGERIYHMPGGQYYARTSAEECFSTQVDAIAAGYRASKR